MCKNPQIFFNKRNLTTHKKNYIPWLHEIYRKNARYISKAINMINHLIKKKNMFSMDANKHLTKSKMY